MKRAPYIFRRSGLWVMRFRETLNDGGPLRTVQRARPLCASTVPKKQASAMALIEAQKLEQSRPAKPEMVLSLGDFVERVYMPHAEGKLRFWTAKSYKVTWKKHFTSRPHITGKLLCTVHTSDVYQWLGEIAATDKTESGAPLCSTTIKRIKSLLSGIFALAVNFGYLQDRNPVHGAMLPSGATPPAETKAYSLEEVAAMVAALSDPTARVMLILAAFTGLSRSEIRGLTWEALRDDQLCVLRGIVAGKIQETKTRSRKAAVPLLPSLVPIINRYREHVGNPTTGPMFRTSNGTPIDPNNLLGDQLLPAFKRAGITFWHGWHGLRRGLATNLYRLGVQDLVIQRILRHSNVAVTQQCYIKASDQASVLALASLDAVLCSTRALGSTETDGMMLQ